MIGNLIECLVAFFGCAIITSEGGKEKFIFLFRPKEVIMRRSRNNKRMANYTKEQLWELYKKLPEDLQKATFSDEVAQNIQEICNNNGVTEDEIISEIAKNIGYVFLGLLPPGELSYVLEKNLKIEKNKAEEIASEIIRFVFLPLRPSLETLYQTKISPAVKSGANLTEPVGVPRTKNQPRKKDVYKEPID